jgi:hypothetical protein
MWQCINIVDTQCWPVMAKRAVDVNRQRLGPSWRGA